MQGIFTDLIDPQREPLQAPPRNQEALRKLAHDRYLLSFTNLRSLAPWLSDELCRLSTDAETKHPIVLKWSQRADHH